MARMASRKYYKYYGGGYYATVNTVSDLLDVKRNVPWFRSWRNLFGKYVIPSERAARAQAKMIFMRMTEMLAEDMIENGDTFVLPERQSGVIFIGDPETLGLRVPSSQKPPAFDFIPAMMMMPLAPIFRRTIGGAQYLVSMRKRFRWRITEKRAKGFKYRQ